MVEGKVKFYLWLLLQNRNWTADRLQARGWPHNALCSLCDQELETANHLSLQCSFAKVIWDLLRRSTDDLCTAAATATSISEWWEHTGRGRGSKDRNKEEMALAAYIVWNLWKERNRRIFEHKEMGPLELAASISDEVNM
uniref:Reverse transcriptase zinc-binding domain-containing protein n=1 Tax=Triticum urartu TaxID=4572 RepID=A0A8R7R9R8_TRIUA